MNESSRQVAYLLNIIDVDIAMPLEIIEGIEFRKASDAEVNFISEHDKYVRNSLFESPAHMYNHTFDEKRHSSSFIQNKRLWKYYVIEFDTKDHNLLSNQENGRLNKLEKACLLSESELCWAVSSTKAGKHLHITWCNPSRLHAFKANREYIIRRDIPVINDGHFDEVRMIYEMIEQLDSNYAFLNKAINLYSNILKLPAHSEFSAVGFFTVLELLVTHRPSNKNGSISHQIRNKLPLMSKRFKRPVKYESFFTEQDHRRLWNILYNYRSTIAHGEKPDFSKQGSKQGDSGGFKELNDQRNIFSFLKLFTRRALLHSLSEPELISDLRRC